MLYWQSNWFRNINWILTEVSMWVLVFESMQDGCLAQALGSLLAGSGLSRLHQHMMQLMSQRKRGGVKEAKAAKRARR